MPSGYCKVRNCDQFGNSDRDQVYSLPKCTSAPNRPLTSCQELRLNRRKAWLKALGFNEDDSSPELDSFVICSKHFVGGKPASIKLVDDIDWVPSLKLGMDDTAASKSSGVVDLTMDSGDEEEKESSVAVNVLKRKVQSKMVQAMSLTSILPRDIYPSLGSKLPRLTPSPQLLHGSRMHIKSSFILSPGQPTNVKSKSTGSAGSTDEHISKDVILKLKTQNERLMSQNLSLKAKLLETEKLYKSLETDHRISMNKFADLRYVVDRYTINEKTFVADEEIVKYFTGLPTYDVLKAMYIHIEPYMETSQHPITKFQQYILTLMCIRLNIGFDLLSHIFRLPVNLVSKIFTRVLQVMFARYSALVSWPSRENLFPSVPLLFRETFGQQIVVIVYTLELSVVIDSIQVLLDGPSPKGSSPSSVVSEYRNQTYIKFLVGLSPQGAVTFISKGCGGSISEKALIETSGLLQNLLPGDIILGERGCLAYEVAEQTMNNNVMILQPYDLNSNKDISNLRTHVERIVDIFKKSFKVWSSGLPVEFFNVSSNGPPAVDKMILVCCALNNASLTVVM